MKKKDSNLAERWQEARGNLLVVITGIVLAVGLGVITIYRTVMVAGVRSPSRWPRLEGVGDRTTGLIESGGAGEADVASVDSGYSVEFIALGVQPGAGPVHFTVHRRPDTFGDPHAGVLENAVEATGTAVTWKVDSFPGGLSAITAFQDLNGDGRLNSGSDGQPAEPIGYSGTPAPEGALTMFRDAAVLVDDTTRQVLIQLESAQLE